MEMHYNFIHNLIEESAECANDLIVAAYVTNWDLFYP